MPLLLLQLLLLQTSWVWQGRRQGCHLLAPVQQLLPALQLQPLAECRLPAAAAAAAANQQQELLHPQLLLRPAFAS
jgi:hypothetical protein